jgi:hypothetical protein
MRAIKEVIDLMAEYNPGLSMMQIGEQLVEFKNRVKALVNALQLHHRKLALYLLIPGQVAIHINQFNKKRRTKDSMH